MINVVSRITRNVLDAFSKLGEIPGGAWTKDEKSSR
jgi:hypothetical protein